MDPLTQALLGAAVTQAALGHRLGKRAWLVGAVAGMIPDADVLIRSEEDPLMAIQFHRGFTHSLAFIPVGGAIASLPWTLRRGMANRWLLLFAASIGYATHGVLDACTTYGTVLLWPFSSTRFGWDLVSIIDPIFTLALLAGVLLARIQRSRLPAFLAVGFCVLYLFAGMLQRDRALSVQKELANARGHRIERGEAFPTIANNVVWRSLYRSNGKFFADRIRVPWIGQPQFSAGMSVQMAEMSDLSSESRATRRITRDFERFRWFSDGWIARTHDPAVIGDARYSLRTDAFDALWAVRFDPSRNPPTEWLDQSRSRRIRPSDVWAEITGTDPRYRYVSGQRE